MCNQDFLIVFRHSFSNDHYVEFSKLSQDRVIGTKEHVAHVRSPHYVPTMAKLNVFECGLNPDVRLSGQPWQTYSYYNDKPQSTLVGRTEYC